MKKGWKVALLAVLLGTYSLFEVLDELGWQYKGGTDRGMQFFNPNDTVGDGYVIVKPNASGRFLFTVNGTVYEAVYTNHGQIQLYRR